MLKIHSCFFSFEAVECLHNITMYKRYHNKERGKLNHYGL